MNNPLSLFAASCMHIMDASMDAIIRTYFRCLDEKQRNLIYVDIDECMNLFKEQFFLVCGLENLGVGQRQAVEHWCSKWMIQKQDSYSAFDAKTSLEWYCACGALNAVKSSFDIEVFKQSDWCPLQWAVRNRHHNVVMWLFQQAVNNDVDMEPFFLHAYMKYFYRCSDERGSLISAMLDLTNLDLGARLNIVLYMMKCHRNEDMNFFDLWNSDDDELWDDFDEVVIGLGH